MPTMLTAIMIACGTLQSVNSPRVCLAQIYYGIESQQQQECSAAAIREARSTEELFVTVGSMARTTSYAECFDSTDEGPVFFYLPQFMAVELGADSSTVLEYDVVNGTPVMRDSIYNGEWSQ